MSIEQKFYIFFALWMVLCAFNLYLFFINKNARFKRKYFPYTIGAGGLLMVAFLSQSAFPPQAFLMVIPALAFITFLNLRSVKFCDACGSTVRSGGFSKPDHCHKCGAPLT